MAANFSRRGELFGKPATYSLQFTNLFSPDFSQSQFSFSGVTMLTLKETETSRFGLGAALVLRRTSKMPLFFLVNYNKTFKNNWQLNANLPYRLAIRKEFSQKNSLSFINEMSGTMAFYKINDKYFPGSSRYSTSEIKSGLTFEHRIGQNLVFSVSSGAMYTIASKMREKNKYWDNSFYLKNESSLDAYLNVSLSVLAF